MLLDHIIDKYKTLSIVGMSKNSGKTVTLNHLISEAAFEGLTIGITSIGRDGESDDIVTDTEKPKIYLTEGSLIATARSLMSLSDANIEILKVTNYRTPMGEVIIGRVRTSGYVQIAGPKLISEIDELSQEMLNMGADLVLVDGALDRISSADPSVSEATILATGAVISRNKRKTIEETAHIVNLFNLEEVDEYREEIKNLIDERTSALISNNGEITEIPIITALNAGKIIADYVDEESKYLIIPGSLVDKTLKDLIDSTDLYKNLTIVIADGTKVFIAPREWQILLRKGLKVKVLHKINLVAITINPYAPQGYYFKPEDYLKEMKEFIPNIPIMDLMLGSD